MHTGLDSEYGTLTPLMGADLSGSSKRVVPSTIKRQS